MFSLEFEVHEFWLDKACIFKFCNFMKDWEKMEVRQEYVIQTSGLTKDYGVVLALESLNLVVPKNSIFAFLGPVLHYQ